MTFAAFASLSAAAVTLPKVTLLPLQPEGDLTAEDADGLTFLLREAVTRAAEGEVEEPFLVLLPEGKKDGRRAKKCKLKIRCLQKIMRQRGSDLLAAGILRETEDALEIELLVLTQGKRRAAGSGEDGPRRVRASIVGDLAAMQLPLDRLVRLAFAPSTLAGSLLVTGQPDGAEILIDGALAGRLPLAGPLHGLTEGLHTVTARHDGFQALDKPVRIRFRQTTEVDFVLSPGLTLRASASETNAPEKREPLLSGVHLWGPSTIGGIAVASFAAAAVSGGGAYWQALETQRRAEAQQLLFPRDTILVRSGQVLAGTANLLYGLSALLAASAGIWVGTVFVLDLLPAGEERQRAAPARGVPVGPGRGDEEEDEEQEAIPLNDNNDDDDLPANMPSGDDRQTRGRS